GEQLAGREDHSRRAEPALQPMLVPERLLHRMQLAVLRQAFDGGDGAPFGLDREQRAGLHGPAVEEDGAGAALAGVAPYVRPGQAEDVAQEMDEQQAGLDLAGLSNAVDLDGDGAHGGPLSGPCERPRPGGPWALAPGGQAVNTRRGAPALASEAGAPRMVLLDLERLHDPLPVLLRELHPRLAGVVLVADLDLRLLDGDALDVERLAPGAHLGEADQHRVAVAGLGVDRQFLARPLHRHLVDGHGAQ